VSLTSYSSYLHRQLRNIYYFSIIDARLRLLLAIREHEASKTDAIKILMGSTRGLQISNPDALFSLNYGFLEEGNFSLVLAPSFNFFDQPIV